MQCNAMLKLDAFIAVIHVVISMWNRTSDPLFFCVKNLYISGFFTIRQPKEHKYCIYMWDFVDDDKQKLTMEYIEECSMTAAY